MLNAIQTILHSMSFYGLQWNAVFWRLSLWEYHQRIVLFFPQNLIVSLENLPSTLHKLFNIICQVNLKLLISFASLCEECFTAVYTFVESHYCVFLYHQVLMIHSGFLYWSHVCIQRPRPWYFMSNTKLLSGHIIIEILHDLVS